MKEHYNFFDPENAILFDEEDMLTTLDNPYDPHEDYEKWSIWDEENEYFTPQLIDRYAQFDPEDDDYTTAIKYSWALEQILDSDDAEIYRII